MSERARLAHVDYIRLAGLEGCFLYFERFLRNGFDAWPIQLRLNYSSLSAWQGVRLSMPDRPWRNEELNMLTQALASFARQSGPPLELNHGCDQEISGGRPTRIVRWRRLPSCAK